MPQDPNSPSEETKGDQTPQDNNQQQVLEAELEHWAFPPFRAFHPSAQQLISSRRQLSSRGSNAQNEFHIK